MGYSYPGHMTHRLKKEGITVANSKALVMMVTVIGVFALFGCAADLIESIVTDNLDRGTVTAVIDGVPYSDDVAYLQVHTNTIQVYAARRTGTQTGNVLRIVLRPEDVPGTVPLSDAGNRASWRPRNTDAEYKSFAGCGEVIVSSFDGSTAVGTFSFRLRNDHGQEVNITNGTFNVGSL